MRLAACYNVWDGVELLSGSIKCIEKYVDLIIIVWQDVSNFGEKYDPLPEIMEAVKDCHIDKIILEKYEPHTGTGFTNEIKKRNIGLDIAYNNICTHFIHLDCDELYNNFDSLLYSYIQAEQAGHDGSCIKMYTYFKSPTLALETPDNYYVPFIHKLYPTTRAGSPTYPFYCDPTRKINNTKIVFLPGGFMHHFSWVRKDIHRKIRNSSAKKNIERSNLLEDYHKAEAGYYLKDYNQHLVAVQNLFNINI